MSIERTIIFVEGMTCASCEARIRKALVAVPGVSAAEASLGGGKATVDYDASLTGRSGLEAAILRAGYSPRAQKGRGSLIAVGIGLILAAAYLTANALGAFNAFPTAGPSLGYAMLFVVGLLTSLHCVAMCGGIAISQSIGASSAAPSGGSSGFTRFLPGLLYNSGRVVAYTAIGAIIGALGSVFDFSPLAKGIIAGLAGLFMVLFGLRMLGVVKIDARLGNLLPQKFRAGAARLAAGIRSRGPFAVGLMGGLMPCGPLQTMQLYALGTGSALAGAFSMFVFSLGTLPLMLAFGATAALIPRKFVPAMVKASAVLVMTLGLLTAARAASLAGIPLPSLPGARSFVSASKGGPSSASAILVSGTASRNGITAVVSGGTQSVVTEFKDGYYVPFTVQAGLPLKWIIRVKASDLTGCNNPLTVPAYGIRKTLVPGDNLVEFTPKSKGAIAYSCWMGMIRSKITVVDVIGKADSLGEATADLSAPPAPEAASGCCGIRPAGEAALNGERSVL
jgi:uncharacterized protein